MSEFKKCKVIMLPTGDITGIVLHSTGLDKIVHTEESELKAVLDIGGTSQHLYITSDEEIKLGDYYYRPGFNEIFRGSGFVEGDSKVIASTEKLNELPQITQSFVKKYCEAGGIDDIELEIEEYCRKLTCKNSECNNDCKEKQSRIKTDLNNCIILRPIKESWTREEVEALLYKHTEDMFNQRIFLEDWIRQNL